MTTLEGAIVITGSNGSLGRALVRQIASRSGPGSYFGLYTVRNSASASALHQTLADYPHHQYDILSLDLTEPESVREAAEVIHRRVSSSTIPRIRALILNAGYQNLLEQTWGSDGLDTSFTANYLGHWLLTLLLLKNMDAALGRIVVVGSQVHDQLNRMIKPGPFPSDTIFNDQTTFESIAKGNWSSIIEGRPWRSGYRRYGAAKLCAMMMVHELQHRMCHDPNLSNVCVLTVDPGFMTTGLQRHAPWIVRFLVFQVLFPIIAWLWPSGPVRTPDTSASHIIRAALETGPGVGKFPRALCFDGAELAETSIESKDVKKREMVWKESIKLSGLAAGETILADWE